MYLFIQLVNLNMTSQYQNDGFQQLYSGSHIYFIIAATQGVG